jgi:hypothetical protein
MGRPVGGWGHPEGPTEARRERTDAAQADRKADVGDTPVGDAEERSGALEPAREEVLVRRLAEHAAELPAEVGGREVGHFRQGGHVERLAIAGIDQILCAQEVTRRMEGRMEGPQDSEYCFATKLREARRPRSSCGAGGTLRGFESRRLHLQPESEAASS